MTTTSGRPISSGGWSWYRRRWPAASTSAASSTGRAVDNYEWFHGFEPTAAFGLIDRDRNVRASAEVLGREARGANG